MQQGAPFKKILLKPPKERGKKVDSTLLDVKASTLQHVGQPYTVGRAGSTRNKETTEASVRKRFETSVRLEFHNCFLPSFLSFFIFSYSFVLFSVFLFFVIFFLVAPFALYLFRSIVLRRQQGVEHCSSRDTVATVNHNLCVWQSLRQEKARDQERTVKSICYRIFFLSGRS